MSAEHVVEETTRKKTRAREVEELTAGVKARAAQAREKASQKVTAEDVLRRREEKQAERYSSPEERQAKRSSLMRTGAGIALLIAAGVTLLVSGSIAATAAGERAEGASQIQELRENIAYLEEATGIGQAEVIDQSAQVEDAAALLEKVRGKAGEIAALQNEFQALLAASPEDTGNGAPSKGYMDAVEHRKTMAPFFAEGTYMLTDELAYSATSIFPLNATQIDPRLQWYERQLDKGGYSWDVVSVTGNASGDVSKTDVTWLAQDDETGDLLAWASASWSTDVEAFVSLTVGTTSLGDHQNAAQALTTDVEE